MGTWRSFWNRFTWNVPPGFCDRCRTVACVQQRRRGVFGPALGIVPIDMLVEVCPACGEIGAMQAALAPLAQTDASAAWRRFNEPWTESTGR